MLDFSALAFTIIYNSCLIVASPLERQQIWQISIYSPTWPWDNIYYNINHISRLSCYMHTGRELMWYLKKNSPIICVCKHLSINKCIFHIMYTINHIKNYYNMHIFNPFYFKACTDLCYLQLICIDVFRPVQALFKRYQAYIIDIHK